MKFGNKLVLNARVQKSSVRTKINASKRRIVNAQTVYSSIQSSFTEDIVIIEIIEASKIPLVNIMSIKLN
jgi:hypothetical protein